MMNITIENLVAYIYREMPDNQRIIVKNAIATDTKLAETYYQLKEGFKQLPKVQFNPPTHVLNNIMKYSNESAVELQF